MGWIGGVTGASAAAAARKQQEEDEEVLMLMQEEHGEGWEFKIMRGFLYPFDNQEKLRKMLAEEAEAGWELAAKLDGARVMLRRRVELRDRDYMTPGKDPYRTEYSGGGSPVIVLALIGLVLLLAAGVILTIVLIN